MNSDWHVEDSPWKAHQVDKIIKRNKLTPTTICEVGCGAGEILKQLSLKSNYAKVDFTGYEISSDAFELCRTRSAERLTYLKKDLLEDEKQYDITLCLDVFEHVENYMGFDPYIENETYVKNEIKNLVKEYMEIWKKQLTRL